MSTKKICLKVPAVRPRTGRTIRIESGDSQNVTGASKVVTPKEVVKGLEVTKGEEESVVTVPKVELTDLTVEILKAGLFIHWGVYTVPAFGRSKPSTSSSETHNGSEWYLGYIKNRGLYGPEVFNHHKAVFGDDNLEDVEKRYYNDWLTQFDIAASLNQGKNHNPWTIYADYAVKLGMQYIILTVKHHDGILLTHSSNTAYKKRQTQIDHVDLFVKSCMSRGLKVGLYFSLFEWAGKRVTNIPYTTGKGLSDYCNKVLWPSLKEICLRFRPDILWADGHWRHTVAEWGSLDFLSWFTKEFPSSLINDRWGKDFSEMLPSLPDLKRICCLTGKDRLIMKPSTTTTATSSDSHDNPLSWEHVNTIGDSWGYAQNNPKYKTADQILGLFKTVKAAKGRFTLNIGPRLDGSLDPMEEEVLNMLVSKGGFT